MREKHQHFVDRYLVHGIASRAAEEAGYSVRRARQTGRELLRRPDIAAAIRKAQADRAERLGIDADWVVQKTVEVLHLAVAGSPKLHRGKPVIVDGAYVMEWSPTGAVQALNLLVKVLGLGPPGRNVVEHEGEIVYTLRVDDGPRIIDRTLTPDALTAGD